MNEDQTLQVTDTHTGYQVQSVKLTSKIGTEKWRIQVDKAYRYITHKEIGSYQ
jgi:hypothetical protein